MSSESVTITLAVFGIVYLGMMLGRLPGLKVDRVAIALLGAIALLASGAISRHDALASVGFDTLALLFGLMIVSAQFTLSGLYEAVTHRVVGLNVGPQTLLAILITTAGILSALLTNDVVALAMAPVLIQLCIGRRLNPMPFLLALALSVNAGATATIMGSPQAMLIAQHLDIHFVEFSTYTAVPSVFALGAIWLMLTLFFRGKWQLSEDVTTTTTAPIQLDRLESVLGIVVMAAVVAFLVFTDWPRDLVALSGGGLLLMNAHFKSRKMLDHVDWQLLVLFVGLFVVNGAFQQTELPQQWLADVKAYGLDLLHPAALFLTTAVLSDVVSNVPAVMLLLPFAEGPVAGPAMALASGMASNLIIVGSIANIIVVDAAARNKLKISFWDFARVGIPVTLISLAFAGMWLWLLITIVY
jgi:Na+/H+ antiporter NhaD/arsenite permease-like protein